MNAHYQCVYEIHDADIDDVTAHNIQIANTVVEVAWPYLRELCSSLTSRMGIPAFTLPMYTPAQTSSQGVKELAAPKKTVKKKKPTP